MGGRPRAWRGRGREHVAAEALWRTHMNRAIVPAKPGMYCSNVTPIA